MSKYNLFSFENKDCKILYFTFSLFFFSCKNLIVSDFNSFNWHIDKVNSISNLRYYQNLYSDMRIEFFESKEGIMDIGFRVENFLWYYVNSQILINQKLNVPITGDGKIDIPLYEIDPDLGTDVILTLKEGLGVADLNNNRANFINTSWKMVKCYDEVNGYYPNYLFNSVKDILNIENIKVVINENIAYFTFDKKVSSEEHAFGTDNNINSYWKEKQNVLIFLDSKPSDKYLYLNMVKKDDELWVPMKDYNDDEYYLVFEKF